MRSEISPVTINSAINEGRKLIIEVDHRRHKVILRAGEPNSSNYLNDRKPEWGSPEAKIETYNQLHEHAIACGFPSMIELLERMTDDGK